MLVFIWVCDWLMLTGAVVIHHRHHPPPEEVHEVQYGPAERREVRIQTDVIWVSVIRHLVLPARLYVRHTQSVRDWLHRIGWWAVGGAEDRCHAQGELLAGCDRMTKQHGTNQRLLARKQFNININNQHSWSFTFLTFIYKYLCSWLLLKNIYSTILVFYLQLFTFLVFIYKQLHFCFKLKKYLQVFI